MLIFNSLKKVRIPILLLNTSSSVSADSKGLTRSKVNLVQVWSVNSPISSSFIFVRIRCKTCNNIMCFWKNYFKLMFYYKIICSSNDLVSFRDAWSSSRSARLKRNYDPNAWRSLIAKSTTNSSKPGTLGQLTMRKLWSSSSRKLGWRTDLR